MANRRVLSAADLRRIATLLSAGEPMTAIASDLDVSYKTVQKARQELGLEVVRNRARPKYPSELGEEVVRRYSSGESTGQIARAIGASDSWVQGKVRAAGVALRPNGKLAGRSAEVAGLIDLDVITEVQADRIEGLVEPEANAVSWIAPTGEAH